MRCGKTTEITLKDPSGFFTEKCHNIIYSKARDSQSVLYTKNSNDPNLISNCLKHIGEYLPCECFIRIHNNCIVNLNYVKIYNMKKNKIILENGTVLSVSRRKKYTLFDMLKKRFKLIS